MTHADEGNQMLEYYSFVNKSSYNNTGFYIYFMLMVSPQSVCHSAVLSSACYKKQKKYVRTPVVIYIHMQYA